MDMQVINSIEFVIHKSLHNIEGQSDLDQKVFEAYVNFWKWILRQDMSYFNQAIETLQENEVLKKNQALSSPSMKAIRNMLHWISYFNPIHRSVFQSFYKKELSNHNQTSIFLDQEYEFLNLLLAQPGFSGVFHSSMQFNDAFQKIWKLLSLRINCAKNQNDLRIPDSKEKLIIHLDSYEVLTKDVQIFSEPLSKAFHLLSQNRLVFFEDFLFHCFGIPNYDPEIHSTKIRNLISRIKVMLPSTLKIKTKNERILSLGDWSIIFIQNQSEIQQFLRLSPSWRWLLCELIDLQRLKSEVRKIDIKKTTELRLLQKKKKYTRSEVEKIWGVSKATANRRIQKLIVQRKIRKFGDGKNSQYEF